MKKWLLIYNNRPMFRHAPAALIFPRKYFRKTHDGIVKYWLKSDLLDQAAEDAATNKSLNKDDLKELIKEATTQGLQGQRSLCFYEVGDSVIIKEFDDSKELFKYWEYNEKKDLIKKIFEDSRIAEEYVVYTIATESAIAKM